MYVVSGRGTLTSRDASTSSSRTWAAYIAAGERFEVDNPGPEELVVVAVSLAQENGASPPSEKRTVRCADRPTLPAGEERRFGYLADEEVGNTDLTQFLGVIDPSRVPAHGHVYDEVIYVVEGEGMLHLDGKTTPISAGSCIHSAASDCAYPREPRPRPHAGSRRLSPRRRPAGRAFEETK